ARETILPCILHRKSPLVGIGHRFTFRMEIVAPGVKLSGQSATRCELPLRFGRQAFARPLRVGYCIIIGDLDDRILFPAVNTAAGTFGMAPVCVLLIPPPSVMIVQRNGFGCRGEYG